MKVDAESAVDFKRVVKYARTKMTLGGEKSTLRYKRTRIVKFTGPVAQILSKESDKGTYWHYDDKKQILEIYKEELRTPLD